MDHSLPGSSVHEILQVRILEWVAISSSRGSSQPEDQTPVSYVSYIGWQILYYHLGSQRVQKKKILCYLESSLYRIKYWRSSLKGEFPSVGVDGRLEFVCFQIQCVFPAPLPVNLTITSPRTTKPLSHERYIFFLWYFLYLLFFPQYNFKFSSIYFIPWPLK